MLEAGGSEARRHGSSQVRAQARAGLATRASVTHEEMPALTPPQVKAEECEGSGREGNSAPTRRSI